MTIREYLDKNGLVIQDLADGLGISWQYVWMIMKSRANPSPMLAEQISNWTKGNVAVHEIRKCTRWCHSNCACSKGK